MTGGGLNRLNYPKPREGTETRCASHPRPCAIPVELPQAPRGDGNLVFCTPNQRTPYVELPQAPRGDGNVEAPDPSREVVRRKLNYPKPREGTETSRSPKGCGGSRRTVELPQAPRGDGNLHKPSRVVVDCGVELPQAPRGDGNYHACVVFPVAMACIG